MAILPLFPNANSGLEEKIIAIEGKISSLPYYLRLKDISTNDNIKLYIENGELKINVLYYIAEANLIDFTYTANTDDTYTLTGWNGTTNGVPGTEIIIPEADNIIL